MAKNKLVECVVQSIDCVIVIRIPPTTTGRQILRSVLQKYEVYEDRWFTFFCYDPQCQEKRVQINKKINVKDIVPYPNTKVVFRLAVALYPISTRVELIQDATRILLYKFELKRSIEELEYDLLPEWRALLVVGYGRLIEYENPLKSPLTAIEHRFDRLIPIQILEKYGLTRESMLTLIKNVFHETRNYLFIELVQHIFELLEISTQYGVKYFSIKNKKGSHVLLGIDSTGLMLCKPTDRINPVSAFTWSELANISYSGKKLKLILLAKGEPSLEFESMAQSQNQLIFSSITEHYEYFLEGKNLEDYEESENTIKARKAQLVSMTKRKYELEQQTYQDTLNGIINEGKLDEANIAELEKEYIRVKESLEQQIDQSQKEIAGEGKENADSQKDSEMCTVEVQLLKTAISDTSQEKENTEIFAHDITQIGQNRESEIQLVREKIAQFEQLHKLHLEQVKLAKNAKQPSLAGKTIKDVKTTSPSLMSKESQVKREEALRKTIRKVADAAKSTGMVANEDMKKLQEFSENGNVRFTTLNKIIKENNTRTRVDLFESL